MWRDVQLTSDDTGICLPSLTTESCTDVYPKRNQTYNVNGVLKQGWFTVNFKSTELQSVHLKQNQTFHAAFFDDTSPILPVEAFRSQYKASNVWLNVEHDGFYKVFNLSMRSYILSSAEQFTVDYISSPEVECLMSIRGTISKKTKLEFRIPDELLIEPSTNNTYDSLLANLTFVKTFASGLLVPKNYIWPITEDNYLLPHTSIVENAHKAGLEIYASGFRNDDDISYNYSYDPLGEYLSFADNGVFSVDGFLTDFPNTPLEAIGCFSNLNYNKTDHAKPVVISHNGASGDYPGCTDEAYKKAVTDGADVIECPVQVTKEGIPICMMSIDLMDGTTVGDSQLAQPVIISDLRPDPGVFTFNLYLE